MGVGGEEEREAQEDGGGEGEVVKSVYSELHKAEVVEGEEGEYFNCTLPK